MSLGVRGVWISYVAVAAKISARFAELNNARTTAKPAVNKTVQPILVVVLVTEFSTKMVRTGKIEATMTAMRLLAPFSLESEYERRPASSSTSFPTAKRCPNKRLKTAAMRYVMKLVKGSPSEVDGFMEM